MSALFALGCASEPLGGKENTDVAPEAGPSREGVLLDVVVSAESRTFVDLARLRVVQGTAAEPPLLWDVAFQGLDVFTNGGASGLGRGAAFGPLSPPVLLSDTAPDVPFLTKDEPGGAFLDWYAYDGAAHEVLNRFHTYGVRDGERLWKVQLTGYYAERNGQLASGWYSLRHAELGPDGVGPTKELGELDATLANLDPNGEATEQCVDLASEERSLLTARQAGEDESWQLCFARDAVRVNGGLGGPRGVEAVDFDRGATADETLELLRERTSRSTLARFQAIDRAAALAPGLRWQRDAIVSAFSGRWLIAGADPVAPSDDVWLVIGADGLSKYFLVFERFEDASGTAPGRVSLRVKAVQ